MKKSITILLLAMLMGVTTATAEDLYVYVAGKKLNVSTNYTNVTEGLVSGSYTFYSSSKRLVLNNVTIERDGTNKNAIDSNLPGLRIEFVGTTNIKTGDDALALRAQTDLHGQGTVNIRSTSGMAVHIFNTTSVSFRGGNWTLKGKGGIVGKTGDQTVSFYDNVANYPFVLSANGSDGSVWDAKLNFYNNLSICNPLNASYNSSEHAVCYTNSTSRVKGEDVIIGIPAFQLGNKGYATNQTEIKGSNITDGTVTFDKSTRTVTMNNATVKGGPFVPEMEGMKIVVMEHVVIGTNGNEYCIKHNFRELTIQGNGVLTCYGVIDLPSTDHDPKLIITGGVTVTVDTKQTDNTGIISTNDQATVEVNNSNLHILSTGNCAEAKVLMTGSVIRTPLKAVKTKKTYTDNDYSITAIYDNTQPGKLLDTSFNNITGELDITPGTAYDLWLCGVQVNEYNRSKLYNIIDGGDCQFSGNVLTLNKAIMNCPSGTLYTLYNKINGLTINLQGGTSKINSSATTIGIRSEADFTINGNNLQLQVYGSNSSACSAIFLDNATMTVNNANQLYAKGGPTGIKGTQQSGVKVNDSHLYLYGTDKALDCSNFDLNDNCIIVKPEGGIYAYNSIGTKASDGTWIYAKEVEIEPGVKYNLWLNGKQVHEHNCSNLKPLFSSATGTISFDPSSNKLTLNNFQATASSNAIRSKLNNLELDLTGTNIINVTSSNTNPPVGIDGKNVTITGPGSIGVSGWNGVQTSGNLTLKGKAILNARGWLYGIQTTDLTMNPGTELSAYSSAETGYGISLYIENEPTLIGVALPGYMYYNSEEHCVYSRVTQQPVKKDYVIINTENFNSPTDIQVAEAVEGDVQTRIYTTSGVLMWEGTGRPQLPSGIYIMKRGDTTEKVKL